MSPVATWVFVVLLMAACYFVVVDDDWNKFP